MSHTTRTIKSNNYFIFFKRKIKSPGRKNLQYKDLLLISGQRLYCQLFYSPFIFVLRFNGGGQRLFGCQMGSVDQWKHLQHTMQPTGWICWHQLDVLFLSHQWRGSQRSDHKSQVNLTVTLTQWPLTLWWRQLKQDSQGKARSIFKACVLCGGGSDASWTSARLHLRGQTAPNGTAGVVAGETSGVASGS